MTTPEKHINVPDEEKPHLAPETERRHRIFPEYHRSYETTLVDPHSQAVVVLSGPPHSKGGPEHFEELNAQKVQLGAEALKKMVAVQTQKNPAQLQDSDYFLDGGSQGTPRALLIVNGEEEVIENMTKAALAAGLPANVVKALPCGRIGQADTRANFWALNTAYPQLDRFTIVTGAEHVPRAVRTALHELTNTNAVLHTIGFVEPGQRWTQLLRPLRGEFDRIKRYSQKGDMVGELGELELKRLVDSDDLLPLSEA